MSFVREERQLSFSLMSVVMVGTASHVRNDASNRLSCKEDVSPRTQGLVVSTKASWVRPTLGESRFMRVQNPVW